MGVVLSKDASIYFKWLESVEESHELDGGGKSLAPVFARILCDEKVETIYEWCCGPSWIGLWLLKLGICKELVVSDINEKAIACVEKTVKRHNYNVRYYVSDNLKDIPKSEKFDIVVSNPPNYSNIQTSHPMGFMRYDLRPSDIDWKIHRDFYKNIGDHLKPNSRMYISEVEPYRKEVYILDKLYDLRKRQPIEDFRKMLKENDFILNDVIPYSFGGTPLNMGMLKIT